MGIPENSIKQYKIGEKQIVVGNNDRNVELDNLHIVEEFDAFTDPYDKNGDFRISTKSYASIFMNDINELIGNDNEITDAEIEARMTICDSIEQTVDIALQQAEAMRQSILKKAFEESF